MLISLVSDARVRLFPLDRDGALDDDGYRGGESAAPAAETLALAIEPARMAVGGLDVMHGAARRAADHERPNLRVAGEAVDEVVLLQVEVARHQPSRSPSGHDHPGHQSPPLVTMSSRARHRPWNR